MAPPLPDGVLEDDGADRGIMFVFPGSASQTAVRVRAIRMGERQRIHRRFRREGSHYWKQRWNRSLYRATPSGTPSAEGTVTVRDYPWRRILLRPGAVRSPMAGRSPNMTCARFSTPAAHQGRPGAAVIARCRLGILLVSVLLAALAQTGRAAARSSRLNDAQTELEEDKLSEEVNDPTAMLTQVRLFEFYTPEKFSKQSANQCRPHPADSFQLRVCLFCRSNRSSDSRSN